MIKKGNCPNSGAGLDPDKIISNFKIKIIDEIKKF